MSSWFGKYDFQGVVNDSNGMGSASDKINDKRNITMFTSLQNKASSSTGVVKTKNVTINANNELQSVISHDMHLQLTKGQYTYFQDCSFADVSNSIFSTYTQVFNPDQCVPQVVNTLDFSANFTNVDLSNAYTGVFLHSDASCIQLDSSCDIYRYADLSLGATGTDVSSEITLSELERKKKLFSYPLPLNFSDICN